jgi:hypothetical protein
MNLGVAEATVLSIDWPKRQATISLVSAPNHHLVARVTRGWWSPDMQETGSVRVGDHDPHSHTLGPELQPGYRVLVAFMHGRSDSPVIIGVF